MARLKAEISKPLNFEMAATEDMLRISLATKPHAVCLVPERREELFEEICATASVAVAFGSTTSARSRDVAVRGLSVDGLATSFHACR